jgi:peptide deformylase
VRIVWASDSLAAGPEGCLSVPYRRGEVLRSQEIVIEYADITGIEHSLQQNRLESNRRAKPVPMVRDTVSGFTAVIFQHEIDHLDGVLYIDRL